MAKHANATITKGSTVEVTINEPGFHGAWYQATILNQLQTSSPTRKKTSNKKLKKISYLVKYDALLKENDVSQPLTEVVDPLFVRPSPPRNIIRNNNNEEDNICKEADVAEEGGEFEVGDVVDAYHRDGWWVGVVKSVIIINESQVRKYVVLFEDPHEEFEFERCMLRFHVDWVDSRWIIPPKKTPEQLLGDGNATHNALSGFITPPKRAQITETVGPSGSAKKNSRSRERSESNSAVDTSHGKRLQPSAGSKGCPQVMASKDVHQDSTPVEHEIVVTQARQSEDGMSGQKKKRRTPPKSLVKKPIGLLEGSSSLSPPDHHGNSLNQANAGTTADYQQDWPFMKQSPMWATIELYSQKPHFAPMKEMKEDYREGLAIAHVVTFGNLVQRLSDFKPNDPADIFHSSLETLSDLETHGFDVGPIRGRLNALLSLKTKMCQQEDTCKVVEKEIEMCSHEKSMVEKEMDELKVKMQLLRSRSEQIDIKRKAKEEELMRLQTNDLEVGFEKLAATPL